MIALILICAAVAVAAFVFCRAAEPDHSPREIAIVRRDEWGGWCIVFPGRAPVGHYDCPENAARIARLNGHEPDVQEAAR